MTWVDLSSDFTFGSKLTSLQMQNLRDNIAAAFAGDVGGPLLQEPAVGDDAIDNRNLVPKTSHLMSACRDEDSRTATSYGTIFRGTFYKTAGLNQIQCRFDLKGPGSGQTASVRVTADDGSTTANGVATTVSSSYVGRGIDIDISGLLTGWLELLIEMKQDVSGTAFMRSFAVVADNDA